MAASRNDEDFIAAVAAARELVEAAGVSEDSPFAPAAFDRALDRVMSARPPARVTDAQPLRDRDSQSSEALSRIEEWSGVPTDRLEDLVVVGEAGVDLDLWSRPLPERRSDRQRLLALLKTALDRIGWDRDVVPAGEINGLCAKYDCLDQNLPVNLQKPEGRITRRGPRGSYEYRVTHAGLQAAREELQQLADG